MVLPVEVSHFLAHRAKKRHGAGCWSSGPGGRGGAAASSPVLIDTFETAQSQIQSPVGSTTTSAIDVSSDSEIAVITRSLTATKDSGASGVVVTDSNAGTALGTAGLLVFDSTGDSAGSGSALWGVGGYDLTAGGGASAIQVTFTGSVSGTVDVSVKLDDGSSSHTVTKAVSTPTTDEGLSYALSDFSGAGVDTGSVQEITLTLDSAGDRVSVSEIRTVA